MPKHEYWVFAAKPMKRARAHYWSCSHCNDGQGQPGQLKHSNGNYPTEWAGFDTLQAALASGLYLSAKEHKICGTCNAQP